MRNILFANGEFYHIYNRGTDKRVVFSDEGDVERFMQSMEEFNVIVPIGSIYENSFRKKYQLGNPTSKQVENEKLVNLVAYCINPNHYHFLLEQLVEGGVSMFMKRLGGGYTKYFNEKYKRSGVLFQGKFKAVHIDSNEQLLHVSVYVNLNDRVHKLGNPTSKLVGSRSSWEEYKSKLDESLCSKDVILGQFKSQNEYQNFAEDAIKGILSRRKNLKETNGYLLE